MKTLDEIAGFHGHICPGLALGYRVSELALRELGERDVDEEMLAIVENDSCAVDAVQVMTGCTFGKGNLYFRDHGKQVYTFIRRNTGKTLRISVDWAAPEESPEETDAWKKYSGGDRSKKVLELIHARKSNKIKAIMEAPDEQLFKVSHEPVKAPGGARIYPSLRCSKCGEKTMEPRMRLLGGEPVCMPCSDKAQEGAKE
ncbi:MAG: TraR/DksA C4-type zinc finger protein [Thermodesulfovibrionales bacterium]|nr:TraR/DksA C4-type zinc finger protein [Thermodesulfovibrionales bacterium]